MVAAVAARASAFILEVRKSAHASTGAWILSNQKHTDEIVLLLALKDAKPAPTLIACTRGIAELELPEIDDARKANARTCVGIARYQLKHRGVESWVVARD